MSCRRVAEASGCVLALTAGLADAQTSASSGAQNPTQEIARETPEGPALVAGPTEIRIGGYLGVTGIYRSTNSGGSTATSFATIPYGDSAEGNLSEARLTAVLGPTNTGKTHLAMERLTGHRSGMIGFPLRLLARENYDRLGTIKGPAQVALVTGE